MTTRSTPEDYRISATALAFAVRQISDIVVSSPALDASKKSLPLRSRISEAQITLNDVIGDLRNMAEELEAKKKTRLKKLKANREAKAAVLAGYDASQA
jgi:hypothetical protein